MKGILEDNENEAWSKAIVDCDDILEGRTTLGYDLCQPQPLL